MPILVSFDEITIRMYFEQSEHNPPHIHASHGKAAAEFNIHTGELMDGKLPQKDVTKVKKWISIYKKELLYIWKTQDFFHLPPL